MRRHLCLTTDQAGRQLGALRTYTPYGIGKDSAGRVTALTWKTSDNVPVTSAVTRTRTGTIVDETLAGVDARPGAPNYVYDAIGRLTEAWVVGHHYTYDFTSPAPAGCPSGTQANAGMNTNRVRLLDQTASGTAETGYCYDAADRILATTGAAAVSSIGYDSHGNTLSWIAGSATTSLGWDGADRNTSARVTGADPAEITYARDATDRLIRRDASTGDTTATVLYAYTGNGDTADLALTSDQRLATRSISLPGGVLYTLHGGAAQPTWDHPTVRGDLCLTTDPTGRQVEALRTYTPFGEPLTTAGVVDPHNVPDNQPGHMDHGWLGQHQRPYEHAGTLSLVQMGARPYSPLFGRFLSVDPVDGGSANDYDYTNADPVNGTDLDGQWPRYKWKKRNSWKRYTWKWAKRYTWSSARHGSVHHFLRKPGGGNCSKVQGKSECRRLWCGPRSNAIGQCKMTGPRHRGAKECFAWAVGGGIAGARGGWIGFAFGLLGGCTGALLSALFNRR